MNSPQNEIWSSLKWYVGVFIAFWLIGGFFFFSLGYKESFLILNRLNTPFWDMIMPHYTHIGHGGLVSVLFVLLVRKLDLEIIISLMLSLFMIWVFVWLGKHTYFEHWHRPITVFWDGKINFISLAGERFHTFPSGHSAVSTVAFFFIAAYLGKRKAIHGLWLGLIGLSGCYSRLYIGVHFLGDLIAGSMIGVFSSLAVYYVVKTKISPRINSLSEKRKKQLRNVIYIIASLTLIVDLVFIYIQHYQ